MAGASWLGEVVVINAVLVPALGRLDAQKREAFASLVFPRIFRLASVLSAVTVATGLVLAIGLSRGNLEIFVATTWGRAILAGGGLGFLLTLFHFFMEQRLTGLLGAHVGISGTSAVDEFHHRLRVIPRAGLAVLLLIFGLMMYAARGI